MNTVSYGKLINEAIKIARKTDTPISGSFELTPLCNLDCKMCYVHLSDPTVKARMLSGDEWIGLMGQAIDHGMMTALLTGGEAMTHPDFKKIYMYLIEQGVSVRVKTNGILLNKEMIDLFTEYPPYVVDVSLYGCDGESYKAVTGHDVFDTVTENVRAAIAAGLHICRAVSDALLRRGEKGAVVRAIGDSMLLYARFIVPLLLVSAFIEAFVTPRLLERFL
jgi:MoaA/NifB/PqqE/SkfB family radical SAM enzyme